MIGNPKANLVGPYVKRAREARGLTQEQLAAQLKATGMNASAVIVDDIEAQERGVTDVEVFVLANILHVPYEVILPQDAIKELHLKKPKPD
jgi:transcriptional regulator with XRE-family HTH domain